jgi:hypothetical protein
VTSTPSKRGQVVPVTAVEEQTRARPSTAPDGHAPGHAPSTGTPSRRSEKTRARTPSNTNANTNTNTSASASSARPGNLQSSAAPASWDSFTPAPASALDDARDALWAREADTLEAGAGAGAAGAEDVMPSDWVHPAFLHSAAVAGLTHTQPHAVLQLHTSLNVDVRDGVFSSNKYATRTRNTMPQLFLLFLIFFAFPFF